MVFVRSGSTTDCITVNDEDKMDPDHFISCLGAALKSPDIKGQLKQIIQPSRQEFAYLISIIYIYYIYISVIHHVVLSYSVFCFICVLLFIIFVFHTNVWIRSNSYLKINVFQTMLISILLFIALCWEVCKIATCVFHKKVKFHRGTLWNHWIYTYLYILYI